MIIVRNFSPAASPPADQVIKDTHSPPQAVASEKEEEAAVAEDEEADNNDGWDDEDNWDELEVKMINLCLVLGILPVAKSRRWWYLAAS